jgi:DivIVA domain-containing protein
VTGQRGASADPAAIPGQRRPEPERPHFDMVLRGYDRIEVDEYIDKLIEENAALRRELESGAARAVVAVPPESPSERDESSPQYYDVDTPAEDSFGFRAEKLLRLAEREAAEMRTRATRDAESVEATARRRAEEQLRDAEREADDVRTKATQEANRLKKQAAQEAARVGHLHRSTKEELRRLAGLLNAELERPDPELPTDVPSDETVQVPPVNRPEPESAAPNTAENRASNL